MAGPSTHPTCSVDPEVRTLARGLVWPTPTVFSYYDFDGNDINKASLPLDDLPKIQSVDISLSARTVPGRANVPTATHGPAGAAPECRHQPAGAAVMITKCRDRLRSSGDEGSALIMVLGAMTVAMLVVSVALSYAMQTMAGTRHATEWNQAFAAAEAGVDDYLARLNKDSNYWLSSPAQGEQHLGQAGWEWDCDNTALQRKLQRLTRPVRVGRRHRTGVVAGQRLRPCLVPLRPRR